MMNDESRPYAFSRSSAQKIVNAVNKINSQKRPESQAWYPYRGDEGEPVRLGKTTAAWAKGATATITLYEEGTESNETATSPAATLEKCVNKFVAVAAGKWVIVARGANGYWYLISAEC